MPSKKFWVLFLLFLKKMRKSLPHNKRKEPVVQRKLQNKLSALGKISQKEKESGTWFPCGQMKSICSRQVFCSFRTEQISHIFCYPYICMVGNISCWYCGPIGCNGFVIIFRLQQKWDRRSRLLECLSHSFLGRFATDPGWFVEGRVSASDGEPVYQSMRTARKPPAFGRIPRL